MVGTEVVGVQRCRLAPRRAWAFVGLASSHTDVGLPERHEECLEVHRRNLDAALARLPAHPEFRWTAECGLQLISYLENRPAAAGEALARAIRDGKLGVSAVFAQALTGILDHETFARVLWPTGLFAREHGLGYQAAQLADVPGHPRSEEHTSELQSRLHLVCRLLLEKKKKNNNNTKHETLTTDIY